MSEYSWKLPATPAPPSPPIVITPAAAGLLNGNSIGVSARGAIPIVIVIPTATNIALMVAENIVANLLASQQSNLVLPSLYKRAYLVAYETDEIAVVKP